MSRSWQQDYTKDRAQMSDFARNKWFWDTPEQPFFRSPAHKVHSQDYLKTKTRHDIYNGGYDQRSSQPQRPIIIRERRQQTFFDLCKQHLIVEEITLTMNKLSMLILLFALMFLGTVFFLSGFLIAVNVYSPQAVEQIASAHHNPLTLPQHRPNLDATTAARGILQSGHVIQPNGQSHPSSTPQSNGQPQYYVTTSGQPQPTRTNGQPQYLVPPQYSTMGGVEMVQQPRLPSHMQVNMIMPNPQQVNRSVAPSTHQPSRIYQVPPMLEPSYNQNNMVIANQPGYMVSPRVDNGAAVSTMVQAYPITTQPYVSTVPNGPGPR